MAVSGSGCRDWALLNAASRCSSSSPPSAAHRSHARVWTVPGGIVWQVMCQGVLCSCVLPCVPEMHE